MTAYPLSAIRAAKIRQINRSADIGGGVSAIARCKCSKRYPAQKSAARQLETHGIIFEPCGWSAPDVGAYRPRSRHPQKTDVGNAGAPKIHPVTTRRIGPTLPDPSLCPALPRVTEHQSNLRCNGSLGKASVQSATDRVPWFSCEQMQTIKSRLEGSFMSPCLDC